MRRRVVKGMIQELLAELLKAALGGGVPAEQAGAESSGAVPVMEVRPPVISAGQAPNVPQPPTPSMPSMEQAGDDGRQLTAAAVMSSGLLYAEIWQPPRCKRPFSPCRRG